MADQDQLIQWKTNAWQDPAMVSWYSGRMVESTDTMPLKHALEVGLCSDYAVGQDILDVGIGTGRGSLPLARRGLKVTGIDSSQSMLDECQRLAGDTPITLRRGDVEKLDFGNAEFDTLLSLNVVVHFPHWRNLLDEWKRVVRPGGRIVFDVHSLDNYRLGRGQAATETSLLQQAGQGGDFSGYVLRVAVADMVAEADKRGLAVVAIVPYGAFLAGGNTNFLLENTLEKQWAWRRLLSWMASDKRFLELSLFLERELVAKLSSEVTGRYMVVLENRADPEGNRVWLERNAKLNHLMRSAATLDELLAFAGVPADAFRTALDAHLEKSQRNFHFFYSLGRELEKRGWGELPDGFLNAVHNERWWRWRAEDRQDAEALAISREWFAHPQIEGALLRHGVSLGQAMEYFLMERVLTDYMGVFTGERA